MNNEKLKAIRDELEKLHPCHVEQGRAETVWSIEDAAIVERVKKLLELLAL